MTSTARLDDGWRQLIPRQKLIWAEEQIRPDSRYHTRILIIRCSPRIDVLRYKQAWLDTIAAHDVFRLVVDADEPRQRFESSAPDLREHSLLDGEELDDWIAREAAEAFDRARPLWSATLVSTPEGGKTFVFRAHALAFDGRSFSLMAEEVSERYLSTVPVTSRSFADFLSARDSEDGKAAAERDAAEWKRILESPPPEAILLGCARTDRPSILARLRTRLPETRRLTLDRFLEKRTNPESDGARALERAVAAATIAMAHRLSGQRDIVVSAVADPREASFIDCAGPIEETVYLRVEITEGETLQSLYKKTDAAFVFAGKHDRASVGAGTFVSAVLGSQPTWPEDFCDLPADFELSDAAIRAKAGSVPPDRLDGLRVGYSKGELVFDLNEGIYPESIRKRLISYFYRIFDALVADSEEKLSALDIMTAEERAELARIGRGKEPPIAPDLLTVFAMRAAEHPGKSAVEFDRESLSYGELDRITNRLARKLKALGVVRGSRVAVAIPRGLGEYTAILAVLKADGAYVPVDARHPVDRVRVVLEDAEPQILVAPADSPIREALPKGVPFLEYEDPFAPMDEAEDGPLAVSSDPDQLAYILFTSGSTGRPKGVEIPRNALANFLQSVAIKPGLKPSDRLAAISTTTFDMSELDFFLPLWVGATVVIADRETALDPIRLRAMLESTRCTVMQATPTTWRMLLEAGWTGHPGFKIFTGGEPISVSLALRLLECGCEAWNMYGPTETTVYSTIERIPRGVDRITVGGPIDHTRISLRDGNGRLVPRGTIGEICIGGRGVALGYKGRPELTAEKFVYAASEGERYYRTGDLGRYLPNGRLECLGRVDHQVKVRGFRIEPTDIEAQLRSVRGVNDVLVAAIRKGEGDPQLVAYWVGEATREDLHECAKEKLPYYMVPSAYVRLDEFPLTTTGKVDRKRLPVPETSQGGQELGTAPRTNTEMIIASIWREVLGLPFIPVDVDFFTLGGTSFRAVQVRTMIKEAFGIELPLRALFEHPTIEGIIPQLGTSEDDDAPVVSVLAKGDGRSPWFGLVGIQIYEDIARELTGTAPFVALHVPARYRPGIDPFPTVAELAKKYRDIIRRRQPKGPYYLMGLCFGGVVAFETAALLQEEGEQVAIVGLLDAELPIARKTILARRLGYLAMSIIKDPRNSVGKVVKRFFGRAARPPASNAADFQPVDMPFEGPEIDGELENYQALGRALTGCDVLTFRATKSDIVAPWMVVAPDLGWSGRTERLFSHDIPSSHLGIVRAEHAKTVAGVLVEARQRSQYN